LSAAHGESWSARSCTSSARTSGSASVSRLESVKTHYQGTGRTGLLHRSASSHSSFLLSAIAEREAQVRDINEQLLASGPGSIEQDIRGIRRFVTEQLSNLRNLLYQDVPLAKAELPKHVEYIRMEPDPSGRFCTVSGEWNLVGGFQSFKDPRPSQNARIRMVAGAGFEPATFGL
jgi:hypothetical protein